MMREEGPWFTEEQQSSSNAQNPPLLEEDSSSSHHEASGRKASNTFISFREETLPRQQSATSNLLHGRKISNYAGSLIDEKPPTAEADLGRKRFSTQMDNLMLHTNHDDNIIEE